MSTLLLPGPGAYFICKVAASDVRSGKTGYPWIIDQDEIVLFHYEKDFIGKDSIGVRIARNPNIAFRGLKEIHDLILQGKEGTSVYESGWHRQRLGLTPKLAAYTPIRFQKGLIRGRIELEDPDHNLWEVAVELLEGLRTLPRSLSGIVFTLTGPPLRANLIWETWRVAARQAGIDISCYQGTKHSLECQLLNSGVREEVLQAIFGHKDRSSTKRYAKLVSDSLKY